VPVLEPGISFPPVALLDAQGRPAPQPKGETVYAFFKTTCPTCDLTWPFLERVRKLAEGGPLRIVAVSQDSPEETAAFNLRHGSRIETLYDPEPWKASEALALTNVPTLFRVGEDGRILDTVIGFQKQKLEELGALAGKRPGGSGTAESVFRPDEKVPAIRPG
jgi:thiol-disulfide isomerase/thioredoxin